MKKSIGILGGGLSAISLAYFLPRNKYTATILEKEQQVGGLAKSFRKNGFTFDIGPHIIFSKDKNILRWMMLGKNKRKHYRRNVSYYKRRFVKYPFENGLHQLPKEDTFECLYYFLHNDFKGKPKNFKDWMYHGFGKGITEKYLIPYNKKIWKLDPGNMTLDWAGGRIPKPPAEDIIKSALGIETEGYTHQLYFYYPLRGGVQSLVNNILKKAKARKDINLQVKTGFEVKHITRKKNKWIVQDTKGEKRLFDVLVNTMPLHVLGRNGRFLAKKTKQNIKKLHYNSLILAYLGFKGKSPENRFAVYFPEPNTLFHRVSFNNYISPYLSPEGYYSVTAEITFRKGDKLSKMKDRDIIHHVVRALHNEQMVDKKKLVLSEIARIVYGYPVFDFNYPIYTKKVFDDLKNIKDFHFCGRFAEYRYINMNDCIKSAMNLAREL